MEKEEKKKKTFSKTIRDEITFYELRTLTTSVSKRDYAQGQKKYEKTRTNKISEMRWNLFSKEKVKLSSVRIYKCSSVFILNLNHYIMKLCAFRPPRTQRRRKKKKERTSSPNAFNLKYHFNRLLKFDCEPNGFFFFSLFWPEVIQLNYDSSEKNFLRFRLLHYIAIL